jgi:putative glutamine amidotransferase
MTRAPAILISASVQRRGVEFLDVSLSLSARYTAAIVAAGGVPWVLPCVPSEALVRECVRRSAGVMLTGGDDVQPRLYRRRLPARLARTLGGVSPERDFVELVLIREALRQHKPLLAICRGQQILNVALGGTLWVDIPSQVPGAANHSRMDAKDRVVHEVSLTQDSLLASIVGGQSLGVNSSHHQAVASVAPTLRVTGRSPDGIIEALELNLAERSRRPFLLAIQFHPERLIERHAAHREMFRAFVRACARSSS